MADMNNNWIVLLTAKLVDSAQKAIRDQLDKWNFSIKLSDVDLDKQLKQDVQKQLDQLGKYKINISDVELDSNVFDKIQGKLDNIKGLIVGINDISLSNNFVRNVQDQLNRLSFRINIGNGNFGNSSNGNISNNPIVSTDVQDSLNKVASPKIGVSFDVSEKASAELNDAIKKEIEKIQNQNSTVVEVRYTTESIPSLQTDGNGNDYLEKVEQITGAVFKYKTETGEAITKTLQWGNIVNEVTGQSFEGWVREVTTYNDKLEQIDKSKTDNKTKAYEDAHKALKKLYDLRIEYARIENPTKDDTSYYSKAISNAERDWKQARATTSTPENWDNQKRNELNYKELQFQRELQAAYDKTTYSVSELQRVQNNINNGTYNAQYETLKKKVESYVDETGRAIVNVDALTKAHDALCNADTPEDKISAAKRFSEAYKQTNNDLKSTTTSLDKVVSAQQRLSKANVIEAWNQKNSRATAQVKQKNEEYIKSLRDLDTQMSRMSFEKITKGFKESENSMRAINRLGASFSDQMKQAAESFTQWISVSGAIMFAVDKTRDAIGELKELDNILTEISKTSDLTKAELKELGATSFDEASELGKKASDYLTGVTEMSRSGFYGEQGKAMAQQSLLAQAAGDMSDEIANKYIIATNAAYKFNGQAEKLNEVLDGQNSISNKNSIALEDFALAMSEAGTVAANYRVTIEDLSAMTGVIEAVTKSGGAEVGNSIKSILINLQNINSSKIVNTLDRANASMTEFVDGTEKLRDPISILRDLAKTFNSLDEADPLRAEILTNVAGKNLPGYIEIYNMNEFNCR